MVPPKDPYIQVRVLDDIGVVLSDDKTTNFARHSMHFLKRTDAEQFISRVGCPVTQLAQILIAEWFFGMILIFILISYDLQGLMEELTG
jgi:hypothetical protein